MKRGSCIGGQLYVCCYKRVTSEVDSPQLCVAAKVMHLSSAIPCGGAAREATSYKILYEFLDFPLLEGDAEQSKLRNSPSQMGITLKSIKPQ